jgi:hypothetical protein
MIRQFVWLIFDVILGVVLTGALAPFTITLLPERYRGALALWGLALVSVLAVAGCRRALGIGTAERTQ